MDSSKEYMERLSLEFNALKTILTVKEFRFLNFNTVKPYCIVEQQTNSGKNYTIKIDLAMDFPNSAPATFIISPKPLLTKSGESMLTANHKMHTLSGEDGYVRVDYCGQDEWYSNPSFYKIFIRIRLWLEGYERHLLTGEYLSDFLIIDIKDKLNPDVELVMDNAGYMTVVPKQDLININTIATVGIFFGSRDRNSKENNGKHGGSHAGEITYLPKSELGAKAGIIAVTNVDYYGPPLGIKSEQGNDDFLVGVPNEAENAKEEVKNPHSDNCDIEMVMRENGEMIALPKSLLDSMIGAKSYE